MPFAQATKTYSENETRKRTSAQYVKFTPDHRTVLRILDPKAKMVYQHWITEANSGKGMGAICPGLGKCPIDLAIKDLDREDEERKAKVGKKRFFVNVLERTPYTVCSSCNEKTPGKKCQNCGADISKKHEFVPLNQVKILAGGPRLFTETLNFVEQTQLEDTGVDITGYDITFTTMGLGRDRKISALPQAPSELSDSDFIDPETGDPQQIFDLNLLAKPSTAEEIELLLGGAGIAELNEARGIA